MSKVLLTLCAQEKEGLWCLKCVCVCVRGANPPALKIVDQPVLFLKVTHQHALTHAHRHTIPWAGETHTDTYINTLTHMDSDSSRLAVLSLRAAQTSPLLCPSAALILSPDVPSHSPALLRYDSFLWSFRCFQELVEGQ